MPAKRITAKCTANLLLGDPVEGEQHFKCQLEAEHEGPHRREIEHADAGQVVLTWENDTGAPDGLDEGEE